MMLRYDIRRLAPRPKGTRVKLGVIDARPGTERAYERELMKMLRELASVVRADIIPFYRPATITADVDASRFDAFRAFSVNLARTVSTTVNRILDLEKVRHTKTFIEQARRALGISLSAVVTDEDLEAYMREANQRNTSLIRSLSEEVVKRVEQTVIRNTIAGNSVQTLRRELQDEFGLSQNRAQLIARDQTAKFNSDLNRIRQEQAEVGKYEWHTSSDERVRPRHRAINGKTYKWGERTGAEEGRPPGQPIRCRCVAIGIVEWD